MDDCSNQFSHDAKDLGEGQRTLLSDRVGDSKITVCRTPYLISVFIVLSEYLFDPTRRLQLKRPNDYTHDFLTVSHWEHLNARRAIPYQVPLSSQIVAWGPRSRKISLRS